MHGAQLRTASITPTQPLQLGDNWKGSVIYTIYTLCRISSMLVQDSMLVCVARGNPKGDMQQDVVHVMACSTVAEV